MRIESSYKKQKWSHFFPCLTSGICKMTESRRERVSEWMSDRYVDGVSERMRRRRGSREKVNIVRRLNVCKVFYLWTSQLSVFCCILWWKDIRFSLFNSPVVCTTYQSTSSYIFNDSRIWSSLELLVMMLK